MNRRPLVFIALVGVIINAILFAIFDFDLICGLITLVWCLFTIYLNNEKWADRFRENLGVGVLSGLVFSLFRDIYDKKFDDGLITMYFIAFAFSLILLIKSASKGEDL